MIREEATGPDTVRADLHPHNPDARPCIPTRELRVGDTMYARGFPFGRAIVRDLFIAPHRGRRVLYVETTGGWFRWDRVYAIVKEF